MIGKWTTRAVVWGGLLLGGFQGLCHAETGAETGPSSPALVHATSFPQPGLDVRIKDIATLEGIRDNPLIGYGMVVGLNGTGDRQQTLFSTQGLANILQRMGVQVPATSIRVNNVAAVMVTATLPPFAREGMRIDAAVSSIGDAKSLEGGLLLLTPLQAADGKVYAVTQGPLTLGGYSSGLGGTSRRVNHPTVGRIPGGAIIERDLAIDLEKLPTLRFLLRDPDFATAREMAQAINRELGGTLARAVDSRQVEISTGKPGEPAATDLLARLENLSVRVTIRAKVVINERTGTVVMGSEVKLGAVSILHGNLTIETTTSFQVSQPGPFSSGGETVVVPQTDLKARQAPAQRIELQTGATVDDLVRGLQTIGANARDIVAILQAIKSAGALQAELEII